MAWVGIVISLAFGPFQSALNRWNPYWAIVWYVPFTHASARIEFMFQLSPPEPPVKVSESVMAVIWSIVTDRVRWTSMTFFLQSDHTSRTLTNGSNWTVRSAKR